MTDVKNENDLLRADNSSLKGTIDERLSDLEKQKASLLERVSSAESAEALVSKELVEFRQRFAKQQEVVNEKTQDIMLKQETIDNLCAKLDEQK